MPVVTVSLVGDPAQPGRALEHEWGRPWDARPTIELEIQGDDSLGTIRDRAREEFGVAWPQHAPEGPTGRAFPFVAFYSESRPGQMSQSSMSLTVVDDRGHAIWHADPDLVRFHQLLRAAEVGALDGDPYRIYLILLPPSGNGIFVDWQSLLDAWRMTWEVLETIDTAAGAAAAAEFVRRKIRNRLQRGRPVLGQQAPHWNQRNGSPHDVAQLLARRSWTTEEASRLLGVSNQDVVAVLEMFGFGQDPEDERWYPGGDQGAALLGAVLDEVWRYPPNENAPIFRMRIDEVLRTGETMPYPDYRDQSQVIGADETDAYAAWDPDRDSRVLASLLLLVLMLGAFIAAIAIGDGWLEGVGVAAAALIVGLVLVGARVCFATLHAGSPEAFRSSRQ